MLRSRHVVLLFVSIDFFLIPMDLPVPMHQSSTNSIS